MSTTQNAGVLPTHNKDATRRDMSTGPRNKFSFGTWIRLVSESYIGRVLEGTDVVDSGAQYGVDLLTMAAMGAVGLGIYEADPAPSRSFPLYFADGQIVYPQFAYPLRKEIIPIWCVFPSFFT